MKKGEDSKKPAALADGFIADKLFQTRWIVGVPAEPLQLAPGSRIEVDLRQTQEIDGKPARTKRIRLSVSNDPRWDTFEKLRRARKTSIGSKISRHS